MPQIVLIRLKRKAFPEVISHLVPAYCATQADSFFFFFPQTPFSTPYFHLACLQACTKTLVCFVYFIYVAK